MVGEGAPEHVTARPQACLEITGPARTDEANAVGSLAADAAEGEREPEPAEWGTEDGGAAQR